MSEDLSIRKDFETGESSLSSESLSKGCDRVPQPTLTEYSKEGNKFITTKIYLSPKDQSLISDFCLNGVIEHPKTYEEELVDEFLSIGQVYDSVIYPSSSSQAKEVTGEYESDSESKPESELRRSSEGDDVNSELETSDELENHDGARDIYTDYDFDYLNQFESFDSDENAFSKDEDIESELSQEGIAIDHDLSEGIPSKTYPYQKDQHYVGKGLDADIPRHEQPREKALRLGIDALSDAELLALIFGTGIKGQNVLEMSRQILNDNMNHLSLLARLSPQELMMRYKGIGQAKAIMLCAAMALGIRAERDAHSNQLEVIDSSLKAYNLLRPKLQWIEHEEFWVIFLSKSNNLKNCCCISRGGISETVVDVRLVIQRALQESASAMILVHNHPGSLLVPSQQDDELTIKIADAARFFDIQILDHIIIGASGYYSFKEHGHMRF